MIALSQLPGNYSIRIRGVTFDVITPNRPVVLLATLC